ncbi:MAG: type II secretion system protein [Candidatus Pacebacteria bacterium]|nr:type II secretion system protein [Candidatus Paceibacterota bacterium]
MFRNLLKIKKDRHLHKGSAGDLIKRLKKHKILQKFFPGFTLIELLVVIAIIGILATAVMASLAFAREKARDSKRKQDAEQIDTAINLYIHDNGGLPPDLGVPDCVDLNNSDIACVASSETNPANWAILQTQLQPYISELPSDPCTNCSEIVTYEYVYHAPAGVNAFLDPTVPDFSSRTYSIFASALESNEEESFGYGPSVPESSGGGGPSGPTPTVDISASPNPTLSGNSTISWTSTNVTSCTASNGFPDWDWMGAKPTSGTHNTPAPFSGGDMTYVITCTGDYGEVSDSVILDVPMASPV